MCWRGVGPASEEQDMDDVTEMLEALVIVACALLGAAFLGLVTARLLTGTL